MFRFLIALVNINDTKLTVIESKIAEASDFDAAAALAEQVWPDGQISVSRIGRIIGQSVTDILPMAQAPIE